MIKKLIIMLLTCLFVLPAMAGDELRKGADASPNDLAGPVVYNRPFCWDASGFWNMVECNSASVPTYVSIAIAGGGSLDFGAGNVSTGTQRITLGADDPAVVDLAAIEALLIASPAIPTLDDDYTAGSIALTATSAQFTLPTAGGAYVVCAVGNTAYVECGSDPTVVIAADGFTFVVSEGSCVGPMRLAGTKCAAKAATTAGYINYLSVD